MMARTPTPAWLAIACFGAASLVAAPQSGGADLETAATGLIAEHCLPCHGPAQAASGLDLSTRAGALRGGTKGPALAPGDPEKSLVWKRVSAGEMPLGNPLQPRLREVFRAWIADGASWNRRLEVDAPRRPDATWWAFKPIADSLPAVPDRLPERWRHSPIDRLVHARMAEEGLHPSPPADRRTLLRRATFDLIGLPPTPEEIEAFLADPAPDAYEGLVDRLLASPRYGERWGRHWLDVARFAESEGFERDWLRENAWPYRDYVIRSFNDDKPYVRFAQEQIAGDLLPPVTHGSIAATGFLVAGPTDVVGLTSAVAAQRETVRQDQLEEMVGTVAQTFLGLTVNCARCHDHKFDPIPQREYYRFKAAFEGVWQGERDVLTPAEQQARQDRIQPLEQRLEEIEVELAALEIPVREHTAVRRAQSETVSPPTPIAQWTFDLNSRDWKGPLHARMPDKAELAEGRLRPVGDAESVTLETGKLPHDVREKTLEAWVWVRKPHDEAASVLSIANTEGYRGAATDGIRYAGGDDRLWQNTSTARFRDTNVQGPPEETAEGQLIHIAIAYASDHSIRLYRNGKPYGEAHTPDLAIKATHLQTYLADEAVVSLSATKEFELEEARLYDVALTADQVEASYRVGVANFTAAELVSGMAAAKQPRAVELRAELRELKEQIKAIPEPEQVFAAEIKPPDPTYLLARGDVNQKGEPVSAGALSCVNGLSPEFGLEADAPEADRRLRLARWVASPENPLFARVMTNRVWHYHFGRGFVENPNDLGFNGGPPTHPALLDWLATEFIRGGWSVKKLHKLIMMSETYRQSADWRAGAAAKDADNRFLWRYSPRRLEGEAVRDAMLSVSGLMNETIGGPSFRPFTTERQGSLEIYTPVDSNEPEFNRRTVYRMHVSSASSPLLDSLDCPNPSVKAPKRIVTTTALQALSLMNNGFVTRQAKAFADRVKREAGEDAGERIRRAFQLSLGRAPRQEEVAWSEGLGREQGLTSLCWGLFNTSEFLYVN